MPKTDMNTEANPERVQCGRTKKCGWIGTTDDYEWRQKSSTEGIAVCPQCGHDEFNAIDRLTTRQQTLVSTVGELEQANDIAPLTDEVRFKAFSFHSNSAVTGWLNKLAATGHLTKERIRSGKMRWSIPKPADHEG